MKNESNTTHETPAPSDSSDGEKRLSFRREKVRLLKIRIKAGVRTGGAGNCFPRSAVTSALSIGC